MKSAREFLLLQLFAIHPSVQKIFYNFQTKYREFRIINLETVKSKMPITVQEFKQNILEQIENNKKYLIENWIRETANIIEEYKESIDNLPPSDFDEVFSFF